MSAGVTSTRRASPFVFMVGALVALIPWFSEPGRVVADTKLDLAVDPWGYLARTGSAWDSHAFFGQLQNQAYGYLFPMGPFFGLGDTLGLPPWVVQRAWWTVVLVVGFAGTYLLVRRLGLAGPQGATVAAVAFALSPRALTVLGPISVEQWPSAMVPWIILASIRLAAARVRPRIGAFGLLALACASVGGVNATASLAAFAVAGLFVVTTGRGRVLGWWCGAVVVGTLWWSIPLVVLGRYAYPFLDFIETSTITTAVTSVPNVLRGTSHWVAFISNGQAGGAWPAGSELASTSWLVVATSAAAAVGICAIAWRSGWSGAEPVRRFAIVSLAVGTVAMGIGFGVSGVPFTSPVSGPVRDLLDGSLAALRNVHKLDPLVRLPVCLGLAVAVERLATAHRPLPRWSPAVVMALVAAAVWPAIGSSLAPRGAFTEIPGRWSAAARQVDTMAASDGGSTLVAPATRFGEFLWGNTQGDPLEALTDSPVVKRDAIPLGNPGAIRLMDALDGALQSGAERPGLLDLLDRMGVARVMVSHDDLQHAVNRDLDPNVLGADDLTERTLRASGLRLVGAWGSGDARLSLWSTGRAVDRADLLDASALTQLTGGPEALLDLSAAGAAGPTSPGYVFAGDQPTAATVQTDTLRKRGLDVASTIEKQYSTTLQAGEQRRRRDFSPAGSADGTTRTYADITDVRASSSSAISGEVGFRSAAVGVSAAFDGDDDTSWLSLSDDDEPSISFSLRQRSQVGRVTVQLADDLSTGAVGRVDVVADGTVLSQQVTDQSATLNFAVDRPVDEIEVRLVPELSAPRFAVGIASLGIEGVDTAAGLTLPAMSAHTDAVLLTRDPWSRDSTADRRDDSRVLDRRFAIDSGLPVGEVLLSPRRTPAVERLLDGWQVSGPRVDQDVRTRPGAALDQDPATRWTVGYLSPDPTITAGLGERRTITGLSLQEVGENEPRVRGATLRDLDSGEERRWTRADPDFDPLRASRVSVTFDLPAKVVFPVRMPDVVIEGAGDPPAANPGSLVQVRCEDGATVRAGDDEQRFRARVTRADLLTGALVRARSCKDVPLQVPAGDVRLLGTSSQVFDVSSVVVGRLPASTVRSAPDVTSWDDRSRSVGVPSSATDRVVVWHEGFNAGWTATLGDRTLEPLEIDGWRQGFVVPAGEAGVVRATFTPDYTYRAGLVGGGVLVLLALVAAIVWGRGVIVEPPPRPPRRVPAGVGRVLALAVPALLGGWGGLGVGLVAAAVPARRRPGTTVVVACALVVSVWVWPALRVGSWPTSLPQGLGLLLLGLLVASLSATVHTVEHRSLDEAPREISDEQ